MKFHAASLALLSIATQPLTASAAQCSNKHIGMNQCYTRSQLYNVRAEVCTQRVNSGSFTYNCNGANHPQPCTFQYQGPGMPQQLCWDAFQNIIDDCLSVDIDWGTYTGTYDYYVGNQEHWFYIDKCHWTN